jgi:hypothetical protein
MQTPSVPYASSAVYNPNSHISLAPHTASLVDFFGKSRDVYESTYMGVLLGSILVNERVVQVGGRIWMRVKRRVDAFVRDGEFIREGGGRAVGSLERVREVGRGMDEIVGV